MFDYRWISLLKLTQKYLSRGNPEQVYLDFRRKSKTISNKTVKHDENRLKNKEITTRNISGNIDMNK